MLVNICNEMASFNKRLFRKKLVLFVFVVLFFMFCECDPHNPNNENSGISTSNMRPKPIWNATYIDKLKQDLVLYYDKFARPSQHYNTTTVSISVTVRHVDINEFRSTISVTGSLILNWVDDKLKWNSSDYGGLEKMYFAEHEIWQPDIMLYNSATGGSVNHIGHSHCEVKSNGKTTWILLTQLVALCNLDLRYWPFDTQKCNLKFGSWTYDGTEIDIKVKEEKPVWLHMYIANGEWDITNTSAVRNEIQYQCCPEPYIDVDVQLSLTRRSSSYRAIIVAPAFVIILLTLLGFWLPPQAGEKVLLNGCVALIISIFMVYFTRKIPAMGSRTPLIVLFYSSSFYIVCFSLVVSVIVIWISRTEHNRPLPRIIKRHLTGLLGKMLGLSYYISETTISPQRFSAEEMRDHQVTDFDDHHANNEDHQSTGSSTNIPLQQEWLLFAVAIDRIAFSFYGLLFAILAIVYSL